MRRNVDKRVFSRQGPPEKVLSRSERKQQIKKNRAQRFKMRIAGLLREPWLGTREENSRVNTRPVRRRKAFKKAFNEISKQFSGEPRFRRRLIARRKMKRDLATANQEKVW